MYLLSEHPRTYIWPPTHRMKTWKDNSEDTAEYLFPYENKSKKKHIWKVAR